MFRNTLLIVFQYSMSKSKITVFRKGGLLAADEVWRYGDEVLNNYK